MVRNRKGQAAMEFLMTYGWAILAAIVAIAVLAYFGVFSPGKYLPELCTINAPFGCEEHSITAATGVRMRIRNGAGDTVNISSIVVSDCGTDTSGWLISDGAIEDITITCSPALTVDSKFRGDITITYRRGAGVIDQTATGSVTGKVS